ncbi:sensor histidine kinase [Clostridium peptidivorans]|uniref:sensor histidine kinase n=1 Tax=Clostridium peptidivorans TaxID=100174 RepID=UPI000BE23DE2|nr:HAMP domain-containing sensor histidine kinase [Clostridium peptidivorans]
MEIINRQKNIGRIFALYIIYFCAATILFAISIFVLFGFMLQNKTILPANYCEQYIEQKRNDIAKAKDVRPLIPEECKYAVYNLDGKLVQGNVSEEKSLDMWKILQDNKTKEGNHFYKIIQRKNEICIVEYSLIAKFSNPMLQKYMPNAEKFFLLQYIILFISEVIIFSRCFRKRLSKEMKIIKDTTENIHMGNLEFQIKYSNIIEINDILSALDKMKMELQQSLNKQWKMEQSRKEQMAALAHDIGTPLTILKGNAELLNELDLNSDQSTFVKNILSESSKMEVYMKSLIEIIKSERETVIQKKEIDLQNFIEDISEVGHSMARDKRIEFIRRIGEIPKYFLADEIALQRAIINVISNAVDYSPVNGKILFQADINNEHIRFIIEDSGRGFTQEELNYATEQFFQGNKSRNLKNHYGMGLYIAREFLRQHNGNLYLANSKETGGAKVTLEIPIN